RTTQYALTIWSKIFSLMGEEMTLWKEDRTVLSNGSCEADIGRTNDFPFGESRIAAGSDPISRKRRCSIAG
ncbi:MAG: hypothetical protein KAU47_04085, partial [Candidatus Aminicenantes bacterium]|nr:hypothetical protein [Candidatus Aminicenantes bacterium]